MVATEAVAMEAVATEAVAMEAVAMEAVATEAATAVVAMVAMAGATAITVLHLTSKILLFILFFTNRAYGIVTLQEVHLYIVFTGTTGYR